MILPKTEAKTKKNPELTKAENAFNIRSNHRKINTIDALIPNQSTLLSISGPTIRHLNRI